MKTKVLLLLFTFSITNLFAQIDSVKFNKEINQLNARISILSSNITKLNASFENYKITNKEDIDNLQRQISSNSANIKKTADELGVKIEDANDSANQSITDLNKNLSQNTLYWIIAILVVAMLILLVFVVLRKQIFRQKTDLDSNLQDTRKALEEEGVKLDSKLIEVLETQLKIINNTNAGTDNETDHTLALRVADEIVRIQKNLSRMDEKTKGLKQLTASVKRIQDNFASKGYELVEMIGKPYTPNMKVTANFIPDDNLKPGERVITRIIKPQVNYNGEMIQPAQVEVSQGD